MMQLFFNSFKKNGTLEAYNPYGFGLIVILLIVLLLINLVFVTVAFKSATYEQYTFILQGRLMEFLFSLLA